MSNELEFLSRYVAKGKMSRRDFLGRAAALGVTATFANSLLCQRRARRRPGQGRRPQGRHGRRRIHRQPRPGTGQSQVPYIFGKQWGEMIVELAPDGDSNTGIAEEIGSSDDAKVWTLKIRKGVEFHNGKDGDRRGRASPRSSAIPTRSRSPARSAS